MERTMKHTAVKWWKAAALGLTVLCLLGGLALFFGLRESHLDAVQKEALALLENRAGEYDAHTIVLYDTTHQEAKELAERLDAKLRITKDGSFATLSLSQDVTIQDVYAQRENREYIEDMLPDFYAQAAQLEEAEETHLPERPQYPVRDTYYDRQTYLDYLHLESAWSYTDGSGITVAVIDTGIDTDHPEFADRISEYSYNASEDKVVKDYTLSDGSYDWSLVEDAQGHGTAVTGVIAASMDRSGVVGIAPRVDILVIKAECDASGRFVNSSDLVFGLYYAIEQDVDIVNMSFGGLADIYGTATRLAADSDIVCVAAAGNEGTTSNCYPAADANVIGVGALAADSWELASYSNYGDNSDIVAPGTTYTTLAGGEYGVMNGTSLACPTVVGGIALYLSRNRHTTLTLAEVRENLYASCYDLGDLGEDWYYGYGALDIGALICQERGTVTFNMLSDELDNVQQLFIREHTLQNIPFPERLYAVFDGWYYDMDCTEPLDLYRDVFSADLTLYAKWVNEEDGVPYTYVELEDGTIEIRSYTGKRRYLTIPEYIDGKVVSSIGEDAFSGQNRLRQVTLPAQLKQIRDRAFLGCSSLLNVTIPDSVTSIGEEAFRDNVRLSAVIFGDNSALTTIGRFAFRSCGNIQRFEIPAAVVSLDGSAFYGATGIRQFGILGQSNHFWVEDGVVLNLPGTVVVAYPAGRTGQGTLPDGVDTIGAYAFAYSSLNSVTISDGVTYLGDSAFAYSALSSVTIPDSVTYLGSGAFANCASLKTLTLGHGLTTISGGAFYACAMLESVTIPNGIVSIQGGAFYGDTALKTLSFEDGSVLTAIDEGAFLGCALESVAFPASVTQIGSKAFADNWNLSTVAFAPGSELYKIDAEAFRNDSALASLTLPEGLRVIADYAFQATGLKSVQLPETLTTLGEGAFAACHSLANIFVADGNSAFVDVDGVVYDASRETLVAYPAGNTRTQYTLESTTTKVGDGAFYGSDKLNTVTLPEGLVTVGQYGFYDCKTVGSYTLPQSLTYIERYAFANNTSLSSIRIPDNVQQISNYAFAGNRGLTAITFTENAKLPRISFAAFAQTGITSFRVPASVSQIAQDAFLECEELSSVTFAAGSQLESISAYLFDGCCKLTEITFENGTALTSVQAHGFEGMSSLETVDFGDAKLTNIDNYAFRYCENLKTLTIPQGVTDIGRYAFYGCKALEQLNIPASVESIGENAFFQAENLNLYFAAETLPDYLQENWDNGLPGYYVGVKNVVESGDWKYAQLTGGNVSIVKYLGDDRILDLSALDLGGDIVSIGGYAFYGKEITGITLPDSLKEIHRYAFALTGLEQIAIPDSVSFIGQYAFSGAAMETVTIGAGSQLHNVEQYAFSGCENLSTIRIPESLVNLGRYAFSGSGLETVDLSAATLTEIPEGAFMGTKLTSVTLPDGISRIDHSAFRDCLALETVQFGSGELELMSNVFYNTGIRELYIPDNLTYIGEYSLVGLRELTQFQVSQTHPKYTTIDGLLYSKDGKKLIAAPAGKTGELTLPASLEILGFGAFENSSLSRIYFHPDANILTFGYRCFYNAAITEIQIPATVVSFDYYAFAMCKNLKTVSLPQDSRLNGIYEGAFYGCLNLENIQLPDSVVEISDYAFYGCQALKKLPISEDSAVLGIYDYAFAFSGLEELNLPESLTEIGAYAFQGVNVRSVTVPDSNAQTMVIGIGAFADARQLEEITLPFIGASFENPDYSWLGYIFGAGGYRANSTYTPASLKTVTITGQIREIGTGAFYGLENLQTVHLPDSITDVYYLAFQSTTFTYQLINTIYPHMPYPDRCDTVKQGHFGYGISGSLTLADTVRYVKSFSINDTNLTEIHLPEGLLEIEMGAFQDNDCKEIHIPDTVTTIGKQAFCNCEKLEKVVLPEQLKSIGENAFDGCDALATVENHSQLPLVLGSEDYGKVALYAYLVINADGTLQEKERPDEGWIDTPEGFRFVCEDGVYSLIAYLGNEDTVTLPTDINGNSYTINRMNGDIKHLIVPEGFTSIDGSAFINLQKLVSVQLPDTLRSIGNDAFAYCYDLESVNLPEGLETIGWSVFRDCYSLKEITIPGSVSSMDNHVFQSCVALERVVISEGVTTVAGGSFSGCRNLTEVVLPQSLTEIQSGAFRDCEKLADITIPEGVTTIGSYAFQNCKSLTSIRLPEGISSIGSQTFAGTGITQLEIDSTNPNFCFQDGVLYNSDMTEIVFMTAAVTDYVVPATVQSITLEGQTGLRSVRFEPGSGITHLSSAFQGCTSLESVELPEGVTYIGAYVFQGCTSLESVELPEGVTTIANNAFEDCASLETLQIPASVETIEQSAFDGCASLKSISLPSGISVIESSTFYGCTSLETLQIPASVEEIRSAAFAGCASLKEMVIPDTVKTMNTSSLFSGCTSLESVKLPTWLTEIGYRMFSGCKSLTGVDIPDTVTSIGYCAFSDCSKLTQLQLPEGVTSIGGCAFLGCNNLTEITLPSGLETISGSAFRECYSLTSITLPAGLTKIEDQAFRDCPNLQEVVDNHGFGLSFGSEEHGEVALYAMAIVDPDGTRRTRENKEFQWIDTAEGFRFYYCDGQYWLTGYLGTEKTITLPTDINGNPYSLFYFQGAMDHVIIPQGITTIDRRAFEGCSNLKSVYVPDSVTQIGFNGFAYCDNLTDIRLPEDLETIDLQAFDDTAYYNDPANWVDGCLYIGPHLIKVTKETERATVQGVIAENALLYATRLNTLTIGKDNFNRLWSLTNLETLILTKVPTHKIVFYFNSDNIPVTLKNVVLKEGCNVQSADLFDELTGITIYVETEEINTRWDHDYPGWNNGNKVYYGGEWITAEFYDDNGDLLSDEYYLRSQVVRQPYVPNVTDGDTIRIFAGWDLDGDGVADAIPATSQTDIRAVALYETHRMGNPEVQKPTCDADGYQRILCLDCGALIRQTVLEKLGHTSAGLVSTVAPGCDSAGYELHSCSTCGETFQTGFTQPAGHSYGQWVVDTPSTCTAAGSQHHSCTLCGHQESGVLPLAQHTYQTEVTKAATCSEYGTLCYTCGDCGHEFTTQLEMTAHHYEKKYASETFLQWLEEAQMNAVLGYEDEKCFYYECSQCQHLLQQGEESSFGAGTASVAGVKCRHTPGQWERIREATCMDNAIEVKRCTRCQKVIAIRSIPGYSTEHTVQLQNQKEATCTQDGYTGDQVCRDCGKAMGTGTVIPAIGHNYVAVVTPPTYESQGYTTHTCSHCADSYVDSYVPALIPPVPTQITSSYFAIRGSLLSKVECNLAASTFKKRLNEGEYCHLYRNGKEISGSTVVGTGTVVKLMDGSKVNQTLTVIVTGDTNGDGQITITDMLAVKSQLLGKGKLDANAAKAGDTNGDGVISITDFVQLKSHVLRKETVKPQIHSPVAL